MTSASDIITYIGVPLAVLGVLPILYTFTLAILTQRRIRASLIHHGHKPVTTTRPHDGFTIRSSPMTSLIEVELPRYTIAPLERNNEDYWKIADEGQELGEEHHRLLDRAESTLSMIEEGRVRGFLRGGSWRAFHWKRLIVGRKLYRIQYEDELREPPAEIDFSELVHFLLDWGAIPDSMGWEKLKSGGLWTPAGTVLLKKTDDEQGSRKQVDWVLRTAMPDESDGILSLSIRWTKDMTDVAELRGVASLAPGWGRLHQPQLLEPNENQKQEKQDLPARIEEMKISNKYSMDSSSFRFRAQDHRVQRLLWERKNIETGFVCEPFRTYEQSRVAIWFTCAASALLSRKQTNGGLWDVETPSEIQTFVHRESVPCGVMVILGLLADIDAPQWSSEKENNSVNESMNLSQRHMQRYQARLAAERLEATMSPEQARIHKMNREAAARQQIHNDMMESIHMRQEREERRMQDAIASPRMNIKAVAEACLVWLIEQGEIGREWTLDQLAEAVLYLIVVDQSQSEEGEARKIIKILDEWMSWAVAGGMKKQQVIMLDRNKTVFCFAVALVFVVSESTTSNAGKGKAGADMLECLRLWRKVRLG
ncbi:uncharacterized protein Z518_00805 [Rhinocladiella mackenziei CBS 650.93]|uniref:Uncharacterized protein n=1 Tax=Rhinocladiella mackenziei CBS 650.93 TaxID=1442369 RepID=A0A0D2IUH6_9EURO|nr:uncharacterized protein Z518_00805 [Rhinocladiella mackenziei CBS 650.93]KIX09724.1 hypothetical protein Z518_00805 [Rhinocladiella mackenziei CBS 650.93]